MKNAIIRKQLGEKSEVNPYRKYKNIGESIRDYMLYLDFVNFPKKVKNEDEFVSELKKRRYFGDLYENYLEGIKSWRA